MASILAILMAIYWNMGNWQMSDASATQSDQTRIVYSWGEMLDRMKEDPDQQEACQSFVEETEKLLDIPIVRRVYRYEDLLKYRTWLDGRAKPLEPEIQETFALAMSDMGTAGIAAQEMPRLAAAYRLTGDPAFRKRLMEQFSEVMTWSPLQRPGWTCYSPGHRLPADGKDGNWLATGQGVRAIGNTLDILPTANIDANVREQYEKLLEQEIASIVDDWETKRPWFVRSNNPITNQWVLPTEGLVRACLILGAEKHSDAYELGVENLLKALSAHGADGEFEEGFGYASFTVTSMVYTAHAMAVAGDRRALDHPFLKNFPTWLVHHLQPGGMVINCFDAGPALGRESGLRSLMSLFAVCTGSPAARWALENLLGGTSDDIAGFAARSLPALESVAAPPLFASYKRATRVNWRDSWDDDATGVWVRGGHELDQHDHQDRGHVNLIANGKPILIEAGTPSYSNLEMPSHYASGAGHNVLQVGAVPPKAPERPGQFVRPSGWQKRGGVAPITVHRLDAAGGDVSVDGSRCYDDLQRWDRRVVWTSEKLTVTDDALLADGKEEIILFRWHLGTAQEVELREENGKFTAQWDDATIVLEGSQPLLVSQEKMPDNTLDHSQQDDRHTCLVIRSAEKVNGLELKTIVISSLHR